MNDPPHEVPPTDVAPPDDEYPRRTWIRFYAIVLSVLLLDIVVFALLTRHFS